MPNESRCADCGKATSGRYQRCIQCHEKRGSKYGERHLGGRDYAASKCGHVVHRPEIRLCQSCWFESRKPDRPAWMRSTCTKCNAICASGSSLCKSCWKEKLAANKLPLSHKRERETTRRLALKKEVFTAYGGCLCSCCGITDLVFLALDHINGDGNKHRKEMKKYSTFGTGIYTWVRKNNYPSGFQVLCHNCNWAKSHGGCPHQATGGGITFTGLTEEPVV